MQSLRVLTGMWGLSFCGIARTHYPACSGSHFCQERREEGYVSHFCMTCTSSLQTSNCDAENMLVKVSQSSLVLSRHEHRGPLCWSTYETPQSVAFISWWTKIEGMVHSSEPCKFLDISSVTPTKYILFILYLSIPYFSYMFQCI